GSDLLARIGGPRVVATLIDRLYDRIEADPELRPLFNRDLTGERERQKRFFTEWLGGAARYSDEAYLPLQHRHDLLPIPPALAARWLALCTDALPAAVTDGAARKTIQAQVAALASALVNEKAEPSALREHPHGTCLRFRPAVDALSLARHGDTSKLRHLLKH